MRCQGLVVDVHSRILKVSRECLEVMAFCLGRVMLVGLLSSNGIDQRRATTRISDSGAMTEDISACVYPTSQASLGESDSKLGRYCEFCTFETIFEGAERDKDFV